MRASRVGARRVQFAYMQTSTAGGYASLRSASTRTSRVYDRAWLYRARFCASVCVALMLAVGAATVIFVGAVVVASLFDGNDAWIRKASEFSRGWVLNAQSPRPIAHIKSTLKRADLSTRKVLPPPLPLPPPPTSPMRPPRVVEAFFYPVHAPVHTREGDAAGAWRQRSDFLRTYGGGGLMAVPPPPMLEFNVQRARDGLEPFSLVRS